jgi:hypothetical protein
MGITRTLAKAALIKWLKRCGTCVANDEIALAKYPIYNDSVMTKNKTVPLSVKINREVFLQLDDYYRVLRAVGYSKSGLVEEAVKNHMLKLNSLKGQVESRLREIRK